MHLYKDLLKIRVSLMVMHIEIFPLGSLYSNLGRSDSSAPIIFRYQRPNDPVSRPSQGHVK